MLPALREYFDAKNTYHARDYFQVRYEELIENPLEVVDNICAMCTCSRARTLGDESRPSRYGPAQT